MSKLATPEDLELAQTMLPEKWTAEIIRGYGLVISDVPPKGSVTVDFDFRNFTLGMSPVRRPEPYKGRNWKKTLIQNAIDKLKSCGF